jgi:hypothetical protein
MDSDTDGTTARLPLNRIAFALSAIGSPFVVTVVTVSLIVLLLKPTVAQLLLWAAIPIVFAALLPFFFVYHLWRRKQISDMHIAVREQRHLPFAAALISAAVGVGLLYAVHAPKPLVACGVVYLANGLAVALISLHWKISVHTAGLVACILCLALVGYPAALWALVGVPLVLWARVYRQRHTLMQGLVPVVLTAIITPLVYNAALVLMR